MAKGFSKKELAAALFIVFAIYFLMATVVGVRADKRRAELLVNIEFAKMAESETFYELRISDVLRYVNPKTFFGEILTN
jgi:hypothetical protein